MAKEYPVGAKMYLPVYVVAMESDVVIKPDGNEVRTDARFAYTYAYGEARREGYVRYGQPEGLLTAEEVADKLDLVARATLEEYTEKAEKRIRSLEGQLADASDNLSEAQAQVKELTEADCMRVQEFKPIIEERDRLKSDLEYEKKRAKMWNDSAEELEADVKRYEQDIAEKEVAIQKLTSGNDSLKANILELKTELEQEKKRTQVWKDASEDHRKRAEELEGDVRRYEQDISEEEVKNQRLEQENNSLKADILELKAQIDVFRSSQSDTKVIEALKKRINMLEKLKEVHVKTIRRLTRQLKEKDFVISALVKKGIELEEGGESNG
jgi:chromosome segregation ATPase